MLVNLRDGYLLIVLAEILFGYSFFTFTKNKRTPSLICDFI